MKRAVRRVTIGLTWLSLLLCVAAVGLWVRSYRVCDVVMVPVARGQLQWDFWCLDGRFVASRSWPEEPVRRWSHTTIPSDTMDGDEEGFFASLGFRLNVHRGGQAMPRTDGLYLYPLPGYGSLWVTIAFPLWFAAGVLAILPAIAARRLRRRALARCRRCGRDRRDGGCCVECGSPPPVLARVPRLGPALFALAAAASLVLCAASVFLWVRGRWIVAPATAAVPATTVVEADLSRRLPEINFNENTLSDIVGFYKDVTGVDLLVDWTALEAAGIDRDTPVTQRLRDVRFGTALLDTVRVVGHGVRAMTVGADRGYPVVYITTDAAQRVDPHVERRVGLPAGVRRDIDYDVPWPFPGCGLRAEEEPSYTPAPGFFFRKWWEGEAGRTRVEVMPTSDGVCLWLRPTDAIAAYRRGRAGDAPAAAAPGERLVFDVAGFTARRSGWPLHARVYTASFRSLTLATAALPLLWLTLAIRHRRATRSRRLAGHCRACGYDLRASPGRCPECGTMARTELA